MILKDKLYSLFSSCKSTGFTGGKNDEYIILREKLPMKCKFILQGQLI